MVQYLIRKISYPETFLEEDIPSRFIFEGSYTKPVHLFIIACNLLRSSAVVKPHF